MPADLWVASDGTTDFIQAASILPDSIATQLRFLLEVETVSPLIVTPAALVRAGDPPGNDFDIQLVDYGPAVGVRLEKVAGYPDPKHVSTCYVERQNLTMRMSMCRFTRLTNAFSKKVQNLAAAVALHFMHYNFCRVHQTLKGTPAMAVGLAEEPWTIDDLVKLLGSN